MLYSVVYYNGSQRYGQFLQVGPCRLYRALTLLGLALYSKHLCVFGESINLTGVEDRCTKQLPVATSAASIKKVIGTTAVQCADVQQRNKYYILRVTNVKLLNIKINQENCQQKDTPLACKQMSRGMIHQGVL